MKQNENYSPRVFTRCIWDLWFRFKIDDVPLEKKYKISASIKICYGIGPCALDTLPLIQDFRLPKTLCEWGTGFTSGLWNV